MILGECAVKQDLSLSFLRRENRKHEPEFEMLFKNRFQKVSKGIYNKDCNMQGKMHHPP